MPTSFYDEQALAFVEGEAYRVSAQAMETPYPQWDFERLIYVDTTGPEWQPGVMTYQSDMTGKAEFITAYAKDMPLADVPQVMEMRPMQLAGIGYQYNLEEINTTLALVGGRLDERRAVAARRSYAQFMWDTTIVGQAEKGLKGLANQSGVGVTVAPDTGTGTGLPKRYWGNKTPAQIIADLNSLLIGVSSATFGTVLANKIILPDVAMQYITGMVVPDTGGQTIYSWFLQHNAYSQQSGQPIEIIGTPALRDKATDTNSPSSAGKGRAVAFYDDPSTVRLLLPMPHKFLDPYQDGWGNFVIPGIFRTGGVEVLMPQAVRYLDGISNDTATGI